MSRVGGAVLYGSEALGGVVNIITKDQMKNSLRVAAGIKDSVIMLPP